MGKKIVYVLLGVLLGLNVFASHSYAAGGADQLIENAKKYIGTPYLYGGTTPAAFDCSGYIQYVYRTIDVELPRTTTDQYRSGTSVTKSELQKGDLVFFETYRTGPSHVGIYIGSNHFIHASTSRGVTISSLNDPYYWGPRYLGSKRVLKPELPEGQFYDVPEEFWAHQEISTLSMDDVVRGYDGGYFKPNHEVTRAQVAVFLSRVFNLDTSNASKLFHDVPSSYWAAGAINAVSEAGYITGDSSGSFRPSETLSRAQLAVILDRVLELKSAASVEESLFDDVESSYWAHDSINRLAESGITGGYGDGTFRPQNDVTRAQFTVFLYRSLY